MRIYISGPITGVDSYLENFKAAEEELKAGGFEVINPAAFNRVLPEMDYEEYMKIDLELLELCDGIYMLEGWKQSKGANREYGYALAEDMLIIQETMPRIEESKEEAMYLSEKKDEYGNKTYICPKCEKIVGESANYCKNCGQKVVKWK